MQRHSFAVVSIVAALGCASAPVQKPKELPPPPKWVVEVPPNKNGKIFAVGQSGATLYPQDGMRYAAEDARGKLALALHGNVEMLEKISENNRTQNAGYDLDKQMTDVVLQNSRIDATWIDEGGQVADKGTIFALAVFDRTGNDAHASVGDGRFGPKWLDRLPVVKGRLYAVGYSGPTFEPEQAKSNAGDTAIDNLATSMRVHVQAGTLVIEDQSGVSIDEASVADMPDKEFRDAIAAKAKLESVWVDADGVRPGGEKGGAWALVSIDVASSKGGVQAVQNDETGPALDNHGNADAQPAPQPQAAPAPAPAPTGAMPASAVAPVH